MEQLVTSEFKLGILGGGQLGRMLCSAASDWDVHTHVLDPAEDAPCAAICSQFYQGDFNDFDTVYQFGQKVDLLTIEIEHVNTEALLKLKAEGKKIHPDPHMLRIIQDKGKQKRFFVEQGLATSPFGLYRDQNELRRAINEGRQSFPFVQKTRLGGYDGRGVSLIHSEKDLHRLLPGPALIEELVSVRKEIAVIVARNGEGQVRCFPPAELQFHPTANLVEYLISPAQIEPSVACEAEQLAEQTIRCLGIQGVLAVEMFADEEGRLLLNEVAPRPHNSGHHTIESMFTSQYEQHLRGILGFPLGSPQIKLPSVMVNLLGEEGYEGKVKYIGLSECMAIDGVNLHIYGKKTTRPFRKMGHATVLDPDVEQAKIKAKQVRECLRIIA